MSDSTGDREVRERRIVRSTNLDDLISVSMGYVLKSLRGDDDLLAEMLGDVEAWYDVPGSAWGPGAPATSALQTVADVVDGARKRIATLSGVRMEAFRLDCRIEP